MAAVIMQTYIVTMCHIRKERKRERESLAGSPVDLVWIHRSALGTSLLESREEREKNTQTPPDRKSAMN
jgi:hypothetical protein